MKWGDSLAVDLNQDRAWLRVVGICGALLALFLLVEPFLFGLGRLQARYYSSDPILFSTVRSWKVVVALILSVAALVFWKRLSWSETPQLGRKHVRIALAACCFSIVLSYGFYDYNYWLGSWHGIDRVLLIASGVLTLWNPAAFPLFATMASLVIGQFNHPIGFSWTDKIPIVEIIYFAAFFQFVRIAFRGISLLPFYVGVLIVLAAFYATTGVSKLVIGDWISENESGNIVAGAFIQNGWLAWWGEDVLDAIVTNVNATGYPVRVFVLALEFGFVFILWNWRLCVGLLISASLMHFGIFFLTGIFFWKWIVLDLAIVGTLLFYKDEVRRVFSWKSGLCGTALVVAFFAISPRDVSLGWFDTRLMYQFELTGEDGDGNRYHLIPEDFSPFDLQQAQGRLFFLTEEPMLVDCFGAALSIEETEAIEELEIGEENFEKLREDFGTVTFNERRVEKYALLIHRWAKRFPNERQAFIPWVSGPSHIWTAPMANAEAPRPPKDFEKPFQRVTIAKREYLYLENEFQMLDEDVLFEWDVTGEEKIKRRRRPNKAKKVNE